MKNSYDIIIVGAGIVGLATAWEIQQKAPGLRVAVLEKENAVAQHQSSHNSNVIHSGVYYTPGSAKAINCLKGYRLLLEFCDRFRIPYSICGKLIVAKDEKERPVLQEIFRRGIKNGLEGIRMADRQEIQDLEPKIRAEEAIWVPQSGIVSYPEVCRILAEQIQTGNGQIFLGEKLVAVEEDGSHVRLKTEKRALHCRVMINCAGLYADKVAELTGMKPKSKILPFRGEYYILSPEKAASIRHLIYPVPDMRFPFLGVHLTPNIHGGVDAGPNAVLAFRREGYRHLDVYPRELFEAVTYPGFVKLAGKYFVKGMEEMYRSFSSHAFLNAVKTMYPDLQMRDLKRSHAGVRAQAVGPDGELIYDYEILEDDHIINVCNAPSPAATSCLAIGQFIRDKALDKLALS